MFKLFEWIKSLDGGEEVKDWIHKCRAAGPLRFNQGDAYLAKGVGEATPATEAGEAKSPLFMDMVAEMKNSGKPGKLK